MATFDDIIALHVKHPECYSGPSYDSSCPMHKYCLSPETDRRKNETYKEYLARRDAYLCACYDSLVQEGVIKND